MAAKRNDGADSVILKWKIDDKPVKVDKWDGAAVKNALDDAVKKVFKEKFKLKENHRLMDGRLIFSTVAVSAATFALLWDIFHPFPESRSVLVCCVVLYFILMAVLTTYTTFIEQGIFLLAVDRDPSGLDPDHKWTARSCLKRYDWYLIGYGVLSVFFNRFEVLLSNFTLFRFSDNYNLLITFTDGKTNEMRESKLSKSVGNWFDENGILLYDLFELEVCKLHNELLTDKKQK
ncbi:probable signal peptidase complex subunit 2 isoform X1 [Centruroides sculpturatus]|uniref:probable signal peptidase complex subunit 2 isoform X1 n=1 Tax=Centruroides sculpturatus TaxID=218467 RepID=UPI000C6E9652|nr:probable signal peptidase complex subunit 2 isoform X1 [Centruroides sculpturatus]